MIVGFLLALLFERQFPGRAHPADPGADADDAVVRRGRRLLPLLLRADLRPAQPGRPAVHRRAVHPARHARRCARRHRLRRRLDVVAVRHAAGAGRPGQRAEVPLRGGRDRPRVAGGAGSARSPSPTSGACCCWRCCSARSRRSSCSTSSSCITKGGPGTVDRDDRRLRLSPGVPVLPHQPERRRSPTSCCSS